MKTLDSRISDCTVPASKLTPMMRAVAPTAIVAISGPVANTKRRAFASPLRSFDTAYPSSSSRLGVSDTESGMNKDGIWPTDQQSRGAETRE